jgi:chromosome segregation ATPase
MTDAPTPTKKKYKRPSNRELVRRIQALKRQWLEAFYRANDLESAVKESDKVIRELREQVEHLTFHVARLKRLAGPNV